MSSAVTGRIRSGWKKFKEVSGMLCTKHVLLKLKGELYKTYLRSVLCYGAECWALKKGGREKVTRNREENDSDDVWENPDG